jgi:DNA-binding NtrC family response regulator
MLCEGPELTRPSIQTWIGTCATHQADEADEQPRVGGLSLREMERQLIETTFARCGGNREQTAHSLKIGLRTLSGKLRQYGYPPRGGPGSNVKAA